MEIGEKFVFSIVRVDNNKNISILLSKSGKEYVIRGIFNVGEKVELVVIGKNKNKYFFSCLKTLDKKIYLDGVYQMDVISIDDKNIAKVNYDSKTFNLKFLDSQNYLPGESYFFKIRSILPDELSAYLDRDSYYKLDTKYSFIIDSIENKNNRTYIYFNLPEGVTEKVYLNDWMQFDQLESKEIAVIYLGNGRWNCDFESMECPFLIKGNEYPILLTEPEGSIHFWGLLNDKIKVRVYKPFGDQSYINKPVNYLFQKIDKYGNLSFRQKVKFEDVVESRALKVIAFDNLRKEYTTDSLLYEKLFSDYDNNNNLWVLTYGNTLLEVIKEKIKSKELDIVYVLLEVLEAIENWVLNSGYLNSFSQKKREGIESDAPNKIRYAQTMMLAISVLLEDNYKILESNLDKALLDKKGDYQLSKYLKALCEVIRIKGEEFPDNLFVILEKIKSNFDELRDRNVNDELYFLRGSIRSLMNLIETKLFNQVFINPANRNKFYEGKKELKEIILLTVWYIQTSISNSEIYIYSLKLIRYISCYEIDYQKQEQIILNGLEITFSNEQKIKFDFLNFNIQKDNVKDITKIILNKKWNASHFQDSFSPESISNVPIRFFNPLGGVIETEKGKIIIPNREQNQRLKVGDNIDCEILASDPINRFAYGTIANSFKKIDVSDLDYSNIKVGSEVVGVVRSIVNFGIFVTLGDTVGLLHASKITHQKTDLTELFSEGDKIKVKVTDINEEKIDLDRLALIKESAKKNEYSIGQKVKGRVIKIDPNYGFYLELDNGASGFIPLDNFCFNQRPINLEYYYYIGEEIEAKVMYINDRGYKLSVIQLYNRNQIMASLKEGSVHRVRVIEYFDLRNQIQNRIRKRIDWDTSKPFCPACQKDEYVRATGELSYLEIDKNEKTWRCLWCEYKSDEQVVIRFLDFPLTAFSRTANLKIDILDSDVLGKELDIKLLKIEDEKYIEVSVINEKELITIEKNPALSRKIAIELGFFYEILSGISDGHKNELLNMCRYFFGLAKMSRSYFHSMLGQYIAFIHSIEDTQLENLDSVTTEAKELFELNEAEDQAVQTFPILQHINSNLEIISKIKINSLMAVENLFHVIQKNGDQVKLVETTMIGISLSSINDEYISEEIWDYLKKNLKNGLRVIQEDKVDLETINLRKRIKEIISSNTESDMVECKSTLQIPVMTKSDLLRIKGIKKSLNDNKDKFDDEKQKELKELVFKLQNPKKTKEMKEIVTHSWVKTIAAFANTKGGELLIGVGEDENDNLILLGLDADLSHFKSEDKLLLTFDELFQKHIGNEYQRLISIKVIRLGGKSVLYIKVDKSNKHVFVNRNNSEEFYIRRNASTVKLSIKEFADYREI